MGENPVAPNVPAMASSALLDHIFYSWAAPFFLYLEELFKAQPPLLLVFETFFTKFPYEPDSRRVFVDLVLLFWSCSLSAEFFNETSGVFFSRTTLPRFKSLDLFSPMITFFPFVDSAWYRRIILWDLQLNSIYWEFASDKEPIDLH